MATGEEHLDWVRGRGQDIQGNEFLLCGYRLLSGVLWVHACMWVDVFGMNSSQSADKVDGLLSPVDQWFPSLDIPLLHKWKGKGTNECIYG